MSAMKAIAPCLAQYTTVFMRLALGSTFLAAMTDRYGLWGPPGTRNVAWGNFDTFLAYAAQLNPSLPAAWIPMVGWGVTWPRRRVAWPSSWASRPGRSPWAVGCCWWRSRSA